MELTTRRLAVFTFGAFALLLLARPPRPVGMNVDERNARLRTPAERVRETLNATADTLKAVEYALWSGAFRDSLLREIRTWPTPARDRAIVDARIPVSLRRHIESVYADSRSRMVSKAASLPLVVALETGSATSWMTTTWIEDSTPGAPSCATVVRIRVTMKMRDDPRTLAREIRRDLPANFPQPRHFGLCGFVAAFGAPSAEVRDWLDARDFRPIVIGYDPARRGAGLHARYSDYAVPWFESIDNGLRALAGRACAAGRAQRCLDIAAPERRQGTARLGGAPSDWRFYRWGWNGSPEFINELATSLGAERFAELWRAPDAPPETYRRLTGVPIDTLARRAVFGDLPNMPAGAGVRGGDIVIALAIAALFAGLATLTNPRKHYS
ncbi:MAG: hypothetical protein H3C62_09255 [Gemmatimonadaceae bacterium]|nr:hypothetical protein [Gemmatimonadaceae bacterium]